MGGKRCLDVDDMPVYGAFFELAIELERASRGIGQLAEEVVQEFLSRYEAALQQLGALIVSIERKIATRGKGKPGMRVRETAEDYIPIHHEPSAINHEPLTMEF